MQADEGVTAAREEAAPGPDRVCSKAGDLAGRVPPGAGAAAGIVTDQDPELRDWRLTSSNEQP
jgi:hypothetical protein